MTNVKLVRSYLNHFDLEYPTHYVRHIVRGPLNDQKDDALLGVHYGCVLLCFCFDRFFIAPALGIYIGCLKKYATYFHLSFFRE